MSTLRRQEPVGLGLRRIACDQVEAAIRSLTRQPGKATSALQAVRSAEAVLTLLEPEMARTAVRRDRAILDRLGSGLSEMTRPAMLLERLASRYKKSPADSAKASAIKALKKRWTEQARPGLALNSPSGSFDPAIYRLVADMAELRGHFGQWPIDEVPNDAPPRGLRRSYQRARRLAKQPVSGIGLAELTASLDQLMFQMSVLNKACPPMLKAHRKLIAKAIDPLEQLQADRVLDAAISSQVKTKDAKSSNVKAPSLAEQAKPILQAQVAPALAESPAALFNRMQAYWSAWRSDN